MKLLKTIGIWFLLLTMAAAMTACKPSSEGETTNPASTTTSPATTEAATTAAITTTQPGTTTAAQTTSATATVPATTAAGEDSRVTYTSALDPVYTIADIVEVGPPVSRQFLLPEVYTGNVTINFDMTTNNRSHDWMVGFVSEPMVSDFKYYNQMSIQVAMNSWEITAINGGAFDRFGTLMLGTKYHVRIQANMDSHTYTAYITAPGSAEAMIGAGNFAFRTRGQNPVDTQVSEATTLAMVVVGGAIDNQGYMENLVITDDTP